MSRDEYSRDGIDKTARQLRESAQRAGRSISHEEARRRVVRAVQTDERKNGR
jgi:hypothetical protein